MYLLRFNIWSSTNSSIAISIENYEIQFSRFVCHAYLSYVFRFSFLTTLDIYKDYFKGCLTWCKSFILAYCDYRQFALVHLSLEEVATFVRRKILWLRSFLIFIVWMNWRILQPTSFSSWCFSHVLGSVHQLVSHVLGAVHWEERLSLQNKSNWVLG